jgi:hypothetical protein
MIVRLWPDPSTRPRRGRLGVRGTCCLQSKELLVLSRAAARPRESKDTGQQDNLAVGRHKAGAYA